MHTIDARRLRRLRRTADRQGYRLSKVPERSRWAPQYGPLMLLDASSNAVVGHSLDLDEAAAELAARC